MKKTIIFTFLILVLTIVLSPKVKAAGELEQVKIDGTPIFYWNTSNPVMTPVTYEEKQYEMRAAWVATVWNLTMPAHTSEVQYKNAYNDLITKLLSLNFNTIFFQVRGMNDSFYESDYAPYSQYLAGQQGKDPGWDVMEYMVETAHANGLEFHAWMNPYRVGNSSAAKETYLNNLHQKNFARQNPNYVMAGAPSDGVTGYILNPGEPAVQEYLFDVVTEAMTKYDIDGIHFDDYFYPSSGVPTSEDQSTYMNYRLNASESLADFRRRSVNIAIKGVKDIMDQINNDENRSMTFGISPIGIWQNKYSDPLGSNTNGIQTYSAQYADSRKWVKEEWVHYICPQIYWNFNHGSARYADCVDWWVDVVKGTNVDLVIGQSASAATNYSINELPEQIRYNQKHPEIIGSAIYSALVASGNNIDIRPQMTKITETRWQNKTLGIYPTSTISEPTIDLQGSLENGKYTSNVLITLNSVYQVMYRVNTGTWQEYNNPFEIRNNGTHTIYYKAINNGNESLIGSTTFTVNKKNNDIPIITVNGDKKGDNYLVGSFINITSSEHQIWVKINHGKQSVDWALYKGPIQLTDTTELKGRYLIYAKTVDDDGVESIEVTYDITIVNNYKEPSIIITGTGENQYYQSATISFDFDSPNFEYRINNSAWIDYSEEEELIEPGTYKIDYRNDQASTIYTKTIYIEPDPKDAVVDIDASKEDNKYVEPVKIVLSSNQSNVTIYYRIHTGTWSDYQEFTDEIEFNQNRTYFIEYYSVNRAGIESEVIRLTIVVNIPPREDNEYVVRNGSKVTYYNSSEEVKLPATYTEKQEYLRGVWVSTVANIDMPLFTTEEQYKNHIIHLLDTVKNNHFNAIFFQVRPMNDAFYQSNLAPWSRYIMGEEGVAPSFDILEYVIKEAHKRGIEVHAWLNPYRVSNVSGDKETQLNSLHDDNFAKKNPDYVMSDKSGRLILNPGIIEVREYIKAVIKEITDNYKVDGIHFDDYFYSYNGTDNSEDQEQYNLYKSPSQSLDDWRRSNVDVLVEDVYTQITNTNSEENRNLKFGISPFGVWQSGGEHGSNTSPNSLESYHAQYADSRKWVKEGWLHYITPQLYWNFEHNLTPFADLVLWWVDVVKNTNVDLIIGHGFYRYAETTTAKWEDPSEIVEQLRFINQFDEVKGSTFFTFNSLENSNENLVAALSRINEFYWTDDVDVPWETDSNNDVDDPEDPEDPENPENPEDPENPADGDKPKVEAIFYIVGGVVILGIFIRVIIISKKKDD